MFLPRSNRWVEIVDLISVYCNAILSGRLRLPVSGVISLPIKIGVVIEHIEKIPRQSLPGPVLTHYNDVIMGAMASQITNLTIVYSAVYSGTDQRKHQSSASLAFVRGIHRSPANSPHKGPAARKCFHLMTPSCHCPLGNTSINSDQNKRKIFLSSKCISKRCLLNNSRFVLASTWF